MQSNRETAKNKTAIYDPREYLEASFETFIFMLSICWIITALFNEDIISSNRIHDVFGYNNVCVGFDTIPARYFAQPLMCLQAYFGIRYATLDNLRADVEDHGEEGNSTRARVVYWFTYIVNCAYIVSMLGWGMLLIALPEGKAFTYHFYIYAIFVVVMYLTIAANFAEAWVYKDPVSKLSWAWVIFYGVETTCLLGIGTIGFNAYDYDKCPTVDRDIFIANGTFEEKCRQDPAIPIGLMASLDYGWFLLLTFTPFLLPSAPPLVFSNIRLEPMEEFYIRKGSTAHAIQPEPASQEGATPEVPQSESVAVQDLVQEIGEPDMGA